MQQKSESVTNLALAKIDAQLKTSYLGRSRCPNELWEIIDSTNDRAMELARAGAASGVIIIAACQKAGRGRGDNAWYSPVNSGLYLSFMIRPKLMQTDLAVVTLIAGVAVVKAIQTCLGIKVGLKWVNDLILDGKKVGGILTEYVSSQATLVIGIGLNLYRPIEEPPPDLKNKIGFLDAYMQVYTNQNSIDINKLIACIANELEIALESMQLELPFLLDQWRAYSVTLGEEISAKFGQEKIVGQAIDINDNGALIIKTKTGNISIAAGEISVRKEDGTYI